MTLISTFKDECDKTCRLIRKALLTLCLTFVAYQVSRNIILAPSSVLITISLHFKSQSDCSILSEVTRSNNPKWTDLNYPNGKW